ncbi:MAG: putative toxin-antitoxin system toxin component, PIN family [Campylobacterales bacterium]
MFSIVADTNLFVSALISRKGASFAILSRLLEEAGRGQRYNHVSVPLILELEEVLLRSVNRQKYPQFSQADLCGFVDDVAAISVPVRINYLWRPYLKDAGDDKVLETAFNASAKAIVTHNVRDFSGVERDFGIEVLTPQRFLERIQR